jgi:predicted translin family RNA/ssDNA-binding protein
MEMKENIVVISTLEYRDLIIRAEKAREKEADITRRIAIEKDRFYENMYKNQIETQRDNYIKAIAEADKWRAEANKWERMCNDLQKQLRKKHWWN